MKINMVKCSDIIDVRDGTHDSPKYLQEGYPLITSKNIRNNRISFENVNLISEHDYAKINMRSEVENGDILMPMIGTVGNPVLVYTEKKFAIKNVALFKVANNNLVHNKYFYYLLNSNIVKNQLESQKRGGTQSFVSLNNIRNLMIPVPTIANQKKIAEVLDKAQELIDKRKTQIEALDELIKSKFIEMFGDLYINNKGWSQEKLGKLLTIERGGSPRPINEFITCDKNGINWIKIGDTTSGSMYITKTKEKIKREGIKKSRYVREGDLLLSNSMSFGRPYILKVDGCIHDGWLVLRDDKNIFNKIFLCVALGTNSTYIQFKNMAVGGVVNNLNKDMVKSLKFAIPPIELQNQFADFVKQVDKLKFEMEKSLKELEDNFNSLMQKAFKGELFN